jgi:hypothetical protein
MFELEALNDGLRRRGIRLTVQQVKKGLWLRGTLPQLDGTRKQQRISLALKATEASLVEAEARAVSLAAAIQVGTYPASGLPWVQATGSLVETSANPVTRTVTEWSQELQRQFWQGKVRTSAAQRTWTRIETELKRLPAGAVLTTELLLGVCCS